MTVKAGLSNTGLRASPILVSATNTSGLPEQVATTMTQLRFLTTTLLLTLTCTAPMSAQLTKMTVSPASIAAQEQLQRWKDANALDTDDTAPYYLKMNFELFDMSGKSIETGVLERWAAPRRATTIISSPSIQRSPTSPAQPRTRNSFLVDLLLEKILTPVPHFQSSPSFNLSESDRTVGQLSLHCVTASGGSAPFVVCTDPATAAIRIDANFGATTIRNKEGEYKNKPVAMALQISYGTMKAITGSLIELKEIQANDSHLPPPDASKLLPEPQLGIVSGVTAGMKVGGQPPSYPVLAMRSQTEGTVITAATISKEGKITSLILISSPDTSLSNAALEAVKTWTYKPYLLNGKPVEFDTQIVVNFNLHHN